jgi:hypothetical protein
MFSVPVRVWRKFATNCVLWVFSGWWPSDHVCLQKPYIYPIEPLSEIEPDVQLSMAQAGGAGGAGGAAGGQQLNGAGVPPVRMPQSWPRHWFHQVVLPNQEDLMLRLLCCWVLCRPKVISAVKFAPGLTTQSHEWDSYTQLWYVRVENSILVMIKRSTELVSSERRCFVVSSFSAVAMFLQLKLCVFLGKFCKSSNSGWDFVFLLHFQTETWLTHIYGLHPGC